MSSVIDVAWLSIFSTFPENGIGKCSREYVVPLLKLHRQLLPVKVWIMVLAKHTTKMIGWALPFIMGASTPCLCYENDIMKNWRIFSNWPLMYRMKLLRILQINFYKTLSLNSAE